MKKTRKILALILALAMMLSCATVFGADEPELIESPNMQLTTTEPLAPADNLIPAEKEMGDIDFNDIQGHWAETVIRVLSANKYVQGNGDGTFTPENNVTRAEFMEMAVNALKLEKVTYDNCLADVAADDWYANTLETAKQAGLLAEGLVTDNNYRPEEAITREDAALIISKVAEKLGAESEMSAIGLFGENEPSEYAKEGVAKAIAYGIMQGDPDGRIRPFDNLTRAEASELLTKTIELVSRLAIYVDPENGYDRNIGTRANPVASIEIARHQVLLNNEDMQNHMFVFIKGGEYYLDAAIELDAEISGSNGYNVVFTSYGDERAQFMSGKHYSGFELHDENLNIYKTYVGDIESRQVYIDGVRGIRARSDGELTNGELVEEYGYICDDTYLADFKNVKDLEMVSYSYWTQPRCGVSEIVVEDGKAKIIMDEEAWPTGLGGNNTPWTVPYYYENAYELLNTAGEWYIDSTDGYLYYIPRPFENPAEMVATIPNTGRLLNVKGTVDAPVHNVVFDNLEFAYTGWLRPSSEKGYNENQNSAIDGKLPEVAVQVEYARQLDFTNNKFNQLGTGALYMSFAIQDCNVIGNEFGDISAGAYMLGWGQGDAYETEIKPTEYKYYTINNKFNNNYVHDVGIEYGGAAAVSATFPKYSQFNDNEVVNSIYSGFHIGWLWETYSEENADKKGTGFYKVELNGNYIHEVQMEALHDGGCIYMCGITGGTYDNMNECKYNFCQNSRNAYGALYLEAGSTYWDLEENLVDLTEVDIWPRHGREATDFMEPRWLTITNASSRYNIVHNNYATTSKLNGTPTYIAFEEPTVVEMDKLPAEAQKIADEAGLKGKYLEQYPAPVQRLTVDKKDVVAKVGDVIELETKVYGRKNSVPAEDEYTLYYTTSNPEVAVVDENGKITITGQGKARVYANVYADGIVRTQRVDLICGDELTAVNPTSVKLVEGFYSTLTLDGRSKFGRDIEVESAEYVSADESIVTIDEEGNFHGVKPGEAIIHATFTSEGTTLESDIAVTVYEDYGSEEALKLESKPLPADFFKPENWESARTPGIEVATLSEDGKSIAVTTEASCYIKEPLDGLYSFDLKVENGGSWPTLALRIPDPTKRYVNGSCYFIGFNPTYVELQRFVNGSRTYFFGADSLGPIEGPGIPNFDGQVMEYGKTYHVVAGTIKQADGIRIILTIDGKNLIDYVDKTEGYLAEEGYMGIYPGPGAFTFSQTEK